MPEGSVGAPNDAASRAIRWPLYLEQVECVTRKLDEMLATLRERGLLERAVVVVHGDHGSRIVTKDPVVSNRDRLTASDLLDTYSTLFAVRAPGLKPGWHEHPWSLSELMRHFVTEGFRRAPVRQPGQPMAEVYLRQDGTESAFVPARLDLFGRARAAPGTPDPHAPSGALPARDAK